VPSPLGPVFCRWWGEERGGDVSPFQQSRAESDDSNFIVQVVQMDKKSHIKASQRARGKSEDCVPRLHCHGSGFDA
jgi:hypothetical protein